MTVKRKPDSPAVELSSVTKRYGSVVALDNISLKIHQGEFYTLLGPSGCGKTTTLNIIGGFIPVTKGEVYIDGKPVIHEPPYRRNVNTVFQNYALFPHMTVAENVGFGLRMKKASPDEIKRQVEEMLNLVSLGGFGDRRPTQLSGGQQQRVALARALINRPDVLLLDEPLGALDLQIRKQLQAELRTIQRTIGITFVYVTHDQEEAMTLSDRIVVMNKGRIIQEGTPTEIYYQPANRFVADFIGESNFFHGVVTHLASDHTVVNVPEFNRPIQVAKHQPARVGDHVTVMVRPERMTWCQTQNDSTVNTVEAVVRKVAFLGMYTQIEFELGDGLSGTLHQPSEQGVDADVQRLIGKRVYVVWNPKDGRVLADVEE